MFILSSVDLSVAQKSNVLWNNVELTGPKWRPYLFNSVLDNYYEMCWYFIIDSPVGIQFQDFGALCFPTMYSSVCLLYVFKVY